jgi:hypothetical protein
MHLAPSADGDCERVYAGRGDVGDRVIGAGPLPGPNPGPAGDLADERCGRRFYRRRDPEGVALA